MSGSSVSATDAAATVTEAVEEAAQEAASDNQFRKMAALIIGFIAMLLAITSVAGDNSGKEMLDANIEASNTWAFYQAKTIRRTATQLALDQLLLMQPTLQGEQRTIAQQQIEKYRVEITRYETEPETGEGRRELLAKARLRESQRDTARRQDANFDYSSGLFQIAVLMGSVAVVAASRRMLGFSIVLAVLGTLLMINGFTLFFDLPF